MYLHNIKRFCFYTKVYENIKFIRRFKLKAKEKESPNNDEQVLLNKSINTNNTFSDQSEEKKNFYEKIFAEIKQKGAKQYVTTSNVTLESVKTNVLPKESSSKYVFNGEEKITEIKKEEKKKDIKTKGENDEKRERTINVDKKVKTNINTFGKSEKYLEVKDEYLKSKEKYLKVREENCLGVKSGGKEKRNVTVQKRNGSNVSAKKETRQVESIRSNSEKVEEEKTGMKKTGEKKAGEKKTEIVIKKQTNENQKENRERCLGYKSNNNNYIFVEYEEYWSNEKINKILEQYKLLKDLKKKLFKGVLYVSPFDTSKCFVIKENEEKHSSFSKDNSVLLYGYISRNRALNNDVVYAYAEKRRIRQTGTEEMALEMNLPNEFQNEYQDESHNELSIQLPKESSDRELLRIEHKEKQEITNENEKQLEDEKENYTSNYCRVVKIVERKNAEIVGVVSHVNVKEKINNKFERKEKGLKVNVQEKIDEKNKNYNDDDGSNKVIESGKEKVFAKIQPYDARLPCFIYDSSNIFINEILNHVKNKKMNIYILTKLKEWNTNQVNPIGSIVSILGNEKNVYGIIYSLLYFYRIYFHLYKETDMFFLKSETTVNRRLLSVFEKRKDYILSQWNENRKTYSDADQKFLKDYDKILAYLNKVQKKNRKIEKYMIKSFLKNREIVTHLDVFTIDPLNAKDLDDALSVEFMKDKIEDYEKYKYKIGVHISDVSFFVSPNSYYDTLASQICNTIYLDFTVIHMLPSILSEGICSLNTNNEKLVFSVFFYLNDVNNPYDTPFEELLQNIEIKKCVIKCENQLNYDTVESFIEDVYFEWKKKNFNIKKKEEEVLIKGDMCLSHFVDRFQQICENNKISVKIGSDIFRMYLLSKMLKKKTKKKNIYQERTLLFSFRGNKNVKNKKQQVRPLVMQSQLQNYCNKNKKTDIDLLQKILIKHKSILCETNMKNIDIEIVEYKKKSHMLIEEIMILTNYLVAQKISLSNKLGILRVHQDTTEEIKRNLLKIIDPYTYDKINKLIDIHKNTISDILSVCKKVLNDNQLLCLHYNILKFYKEANYIPLLETENDNYRHFGLWLNKYIHFTSPIRRYIDIVIHRILNSVINGEDVLYNYETLKKICDQCNYQKKKSDEVQVHVKNIFLNKYLIYLNNSYKRNISKRENEDQKDDVKKHTKSFIKKYFYLNRGMTVSFLIDAYIQEIIITKNLKDIICRNIIKENYIEIDEINNSFKLNEIKKDSNEKNLSYTCYVSKDIKIDNCLNLNKHVDNNTTDVNGVNYGNEENQENDENITQDYFKSNSKKNVAENIKMKNAVVFYVPLLETEKSVSDTNLNLNFALIMFFYKDYTFLYHVEKKILFRLRENVNLCFSHKPVNKGSVTSTSSENEKTTGEGEDEDEDDDEVEEVKYIEKKIVEGRDNYLTEKKKQKKTDDVDKAEENRNTLLQNIFKIIKELKVNVKCEELPMEDLTEFDKVYDNLYISEVFVKKGENEKSKENEETEEEENEKNEESKVKKKINTQLSFSNEYDRLSRFQNVNVFLIPGSQMWTIRLR